MRLSKPEFITLLNQVGRQRDPVVDIGGKGRVVVLRWLGSGAEHSEKKVLIASASPVMIRAAEKAFSEWFDEWMTTQVQE